MNLKDNSPTYQSDKNLRAMIARVEQIVFILEQRFAINDS